FRLDAERVHRYAVGLSVLGEAALETGARLGIRVEPPTTPRLERRLLGVRFAELGTVTAEPQAGNPLPRLFRLEEDRAIVNRLGFNNEGAERVAARLARALRPRPRAPVGLNIGGSRVHVGDPEREIADYRGSARWLGRQADYLAINVSSPNTPGLRDLQ